MSLTKLSIISKCTWSIPFNANMVSPSSPITPLEMDAQSRRPPPLAMNKAAVSRAAVVSRDDYNDVICKTFDETSPWNGQSILDALNETPAHSVALLILENISHRLAGELREDLHIPGYVFDLHLMHPYDHILGTSRIPLGEDPCNHFILNYRQPLPSQDAARYDGKCTGIVILDTAG